MSVGAVGSITCGQCGRSYRWKPELAGRQAKCACGKMIDVPAAPPPAAARSAPPAAPAVAPRPQPAPPRTPQPPPRKPQPPPPAEDFDDVFAIAGEAEEAAAPV